MIGDYIDKHALNDTELSKALRARKPDKYELAAITLVENAGMLRHRTFVDITVEVWRRGGQVQASIDWDWLGSPAGTGPYSGGEAAMLTIAASIADCDVLVNLSRVLTSLDRSNMAAVIKALNVLA